MPVSKCALWAQILADVLGKTVRVPLVPEASAVAGGRLILKDQRDAWGGPLPVSHYQPDPQRHTAYQPYYERYLKVHEGLGATFGGAMS